MALGVIDLSAPSHWAVLPQLPVAPGFSAVLETIEIVTCATQHVMHRVYYGAAPSLSPTKIEMGTLTLTTLTSLKSFHRQNNPPTADAIERSDERVSSENVG